MASYKSLSLVSVALITALGLSACGTSTNTSSSGAPGNTVKGMITGFGSVFVNGVEYDTTGTSFSAEGAASDENAMQVGMVVSLVGTVNADGKTGTATSVAYADEVEGILIANNIGTNSTLDIMGQTVHIDGKTRFKSYDAAHALDATLPTGLIVEVSGYASGTGEIFATRIEVKKAYVAGDELELKGVVATGSLDTITHTFTLGGLTIDYSTASQVPANLAEGLFVEVKSTSALNGTTLIASKVEVEDDGELGEQGEADEEAELLGVITSMTTNGFTLNGQSIVVDSATELNGLTLASGMNVKVEVKFDASGNAVAKHVEQEEGDGQSTTKLQDVAIESIDLTNGSITVGGVLYYVMDTTIYEDDSSLADKYVRIHKLSVDNIIKFEYYLDAATSKNMIVELERKRVSLATK